MLRDLGQKLLGGHVAIELAKGAVHQQALGRHAQAALAKVALQAGVEGVHSH